MTDKENEGFTCLIQKFPKLSTAEKKEGIFFRQQIKQLFEDQDVTKKIKFYRKKEHGNHSKGSAETF